MIQKTSSDSTDAYIQAMDLLKAAAAKQASDLGYSIHEAMADLIVLLMFSYDAHIDKFPDATRQFNEKLVDQMRQYLGYLDKEIVEVPKVVLTSCIECANVPEAINGLCESCIQRLNKDMERAIEETFKERF